MDNNLRRTDDKMKKKHERYYNFWDKRICKYENKENFSFNDWGKFLQYQNQIHRSYKWHMITEEQHDKLIKRANELFDKVADSGIKDFKRKHPKFIWEDMCNQLENVTKQASEILKLAEQERMKLREMSKYERND